VGDREWTWAWRFPAALLAFFALDLAWWRLVPVAAAEWRPGPRGYLLALLASGLSLAVLVRVAARARQAGRALWLLLAGVAFAIPAVNLVEAVLFGLDLEPAALPRLYAHALVAAGAGAALAVWVASKPGEVKVARQAPPFRKRVLLAVPLYVFLYFAAGMMAWPFLQPFYAGRPMPEPGAVALMQLFRGSVFTAVVYFVSRSDRESRRQGALSAALVMAILGGIAPLLPDNPYLPEAIRRVHMVEVSVSNFLFGLLCGLLAGSDRRLSDRGRTARRGAGRRPGASGSGGSPGSACRTGSRS
jgi:hypothetical protein